MASTRATPRPAPLDQAASPKIGHSSAERGDGPAREEQARIKALERENRELRQAGEILRKASAYFAQAEPRSG